MQIVDLTGVYLAVHLRCDECKGMDLALVAEGADLTALECRYCHSRNSDIISTIYRIGAKHGTSENSNFSTNQ